MKIAIGSDHAGFAAKEEIKKYLEAKGFQVEDKGCYSEESVHYPQYGAAVAKAVQSGEAERGVLICGTGIGMSITANKFAGIRATLCHDGFTAEASREHNNANILVMGARVIDTDMMKHIVDIWFNTAFGGGRNQLRLDMISDREKENGMK